MFLCQIATMTRLTHTYKYVKVFVQASRERSTAVISVYITRCTFHQTQNTLGLKKTPLNRRKTNDHTNKNFVSLS